MYRDDVAGGGAQPERWWQDAGPALAPGAVAAGALHSVNAFYGGLQPGPSGTMPLFMCGPECPAAAACVVVRPDADLDLLWELTHQHSDAASSLH